MKQFIFLILFAFSLQISAQNKTRVLELGASSEASIGVGFGTFYNIRPLIKWGKTSQAYIDSGWIRPQSI